MLRTWEAVEWIVSVKTMKSHSVPQGAGKCDVACLLCCERPPSGQQGDTQEFSRLTSWDKTFQERKQHLEGAKAKEWRVCLGFGECQTPGEAAEEWASVLCRARAHRLLSENSAGLDSWHAGYQRPQLPSSDACKRPLKKRQQLEWCMKTTKFLSAAEHRHCQKRALVRCVPCAFAGRLSALRGPGEEASPTVSDVHPGREWGPRGEADLRGVGSRARRASPLTRSSRWVLSSQSPCKTQPSFFCTREVG